MKKNIVRGLALALVLILALGIIPLGALAAKQTVTTDQFVFKRLDPTFYHISDAIPCTGKTYTEGDTIKASNYDSTLLIDGKLYDFAGFDNIASHITALDKKVADYMAKNPSADPNAYFEKLAKETYFNFSSNNIKIEAYPVEPVESNFSDNAAYNKAMAAWTEARDKWIAKYSGIFAGYTPHQHRLSYWYSDSTTHWRECLVCKNYWREGLWEQFMYQNWHSDGDEDRVCDVCGADIPYHEVEVIDSKGGKITVNYDEAPHRRKITASVEVEEGYKLKKLHFTKVRTDGSKQEITRYKKSGEFWTYMPTYDLEVTAEYIKK